MAKIKTTVIGGREIANRGDLKPWDKNPRRIKPERLDDLVRSIEEVRALDPKTDGQFKPLVITRDGIVAGGNMRLQAFERLGIDKIWVSVVNTDDPKEAFKIAIRDNEMYGYYVGEEVVELAKELGLSQIEMESLNIDTGEIQSIADIMDDIAPDPEVVEDEVPEAPAEAKSQRGKIYQVGQHYVMCGDATNSGDVDYLFKTANAIADMMFTDPPYNVDYKGQGKNTSRGILNDKMGSAAFYEFLFDAFTTSSKHLALSAPNYICFSQTTHAEFQAALIDAGFYIKSEIIWVKPAATMGWQEYRHRYEPLFFAYMSEKHRPKFYGDRRETSVWEFKPTGAEIMAWANQQIALDDDENSDTDVWKIRRDINYEHPTQKPVKLPAKAIINSLPIHGQAPGIVYDPFGGSGTTLIAADQLNQMCITMELDPSFVDVIRMRWARLHNEGDAWETATPAVPEGNR